MCDHALRRALSLDPGLVGSPRVVVAGSGVEGQGDLLVAFAPFGDGEMFSPAVVRVRPLEAPAEWAVDYWKAGPVPPRFVALMIADGVGAP